MKRQQLKSIILAIILICVTSSVTKAQVSVNINLGSPPAWGPSGYSEAKYYYIPDVEAYYDINNARFIYLNRGVWIHRTYLPTRYRNYDLYNGYKVVMVDYHGNNPQSMHKSYKVKYAKGYRGKPQHAIHNKQVNHSYKKNNSKNTSHQNKNGKSKGKKH